MRCPAAVLLLAAAFPLPALAQSVVTRDDGMVTTVEPVVTVDRAVEVTPQVIELPAPLPRVAPVEPAYPRYPAYRSDVYPDTVTVIDGARAADGAVVLPARPLTQDDYLREMARRWDASDLGNLNLSPAEMSALTGHVDTNALAPLSGTGVQPANMGPGNSRGQ
jgi:hypothetical protein